MLAREALEISPAKRELGWLLHVVVNQATVSDAGAVEILLDASGSMLQRPRPDPAYRHRQADAHPPDQQRDPRRHPFALRVFGGQGSSCESRLEIALRPLDVGLPLRETADRLYAALPRARQ